MEGGLAEVLDKVTGNFRVWLPVATLIVHWIGSVLERGPRVGRTKKLKRRVSELGYIPHLTHFPPGSSPGSWL